MNVIDKVEGIKVNPDLPFGFWSHTPMEMRPDDQMAWCGKAFIESEPVAGRPGEVQYKVYCLDGQGADRPSLWGTFARLEDAVDCAKAGPYRHIHV